MPETAALSGLDVLRRRASRAIRAERAWPALRLPLLLLALYVIASLARVPQSLPDAAHAALELAVLGGAAWLAAKGLRAIPRPTRDEADRRIERDSRLARQPLLALTDRAATDRAALAGNAEQAALWSLHARRVAAALGPMHVGIPRPTLTAREKLGAAGAALALAAAFILSGPHAPSRLHAGFVPGVDDDSMPLPSVQAWIDRPAYAPGAPVFLSSGAAPVSVPEGAVLNVSVTGSPNSGNTGRPALSGATLRDEKRLEERSWSATATLERSATLTLRARGRSLASWRVTVEPDLPPEVSWNGQPESGENGRTALPWKVAQSHGVAALQAEITLPAIRGGRVLHVPIPLDGHPAKAGGTARPDLSSDPFAGMEVEGRLRARSVSGRESLSAPMRFRLGARKFSDPLARAIVALRQRLMLGQERPARAAEELTMLTRTTENRGVWAVMALDAASLARDAPEGAAARVPGQLWALALYLDDLKRDGPEIADAAAAVRAAQEGVRQQLDHMRALGDNGRSLAEQEELARRTQTLKDALTRRMRLLFSKAAQGGIVMPQSGADSADPWTDRMDRLRSDAARGDGEDALSQLEQMEDMAEHMRQATPEDLRALAEQMKAQEEARAQRAALRDMVRRETGLLDHAQARRTAAEGGPTQKPPPARNGGARDISTMSTADLLRELGMTPPGMPSEAPSEGAARPAPDPAVVAAQSPERRADHALQKALSRADEVLSRRQKDLTGKDAQALDKALADMKTAREALADRHDDAAAEAERKVLADLSEAGSQMRRNRKSGGSGSGKGGALSFIPMPGAGTGSRHDHGASGRQGDSGDEAGTSDEPGDEDDEDAAHPDQDPLGRKLGEGKGGGDSDAHIPDQGARDRARDIERELRRRASDRTRPQGELDYLDRLLKPESGSATGPSTGPATGEAPAR